MYLQLCSPAYLGKRQKDIQNGTLIIPPPLSAKRSSFGCAAANLFERGYPALSLIDPPIIIRPWVPNLAFVVPISPLFLHSNNHSPFVSSIIILVSLFFGWILGIKGEWGGDRYEIFCCIDLGFLWEHSPSSFLFERKEVKRVPARLVIQHHFPPVWATSGFSRTKFF